jgi:hypothetical protein
MRSAFLAAVLALGTGAPLRAGVEVRSAADRLDVSAVGAPISEVLDSLARKTRMKVLYEGATPRMLVTIELRGRTPAQAVLGVLEGLGLNYALQLDSTGAQVETLMIVGGGGTGSAGSTGSTGSTGGTGAAGAFRAPSRPEQTPHVPEPADIAPDETDQRGEPAPGGEPHEVPKEPPVKKPPTPIAPLNPVNPFSSSPFGPAPQPVPIPSPSPSPSAPPPPPAP